MFHSAILSNPKEKTIHLVFADWLEEQGDYFEAALRRSEVSLSLRTTKQTMWVKNIPYQIGGKPTYYVTGKIERMEYSIFQKASSSDCRYKNVFVVGDSNYSIGNITLHSLMWDEGVVTIEAFVDNLK